MKKTRRAPAFSVSVLKNQELFKFLQDILFKRGFDWNGRTEKQHHETVSAMYLYFTHDRTITYSSSMHQPQYRELLTLEEFIAEDYTLGEPKVVTLNGFYSAKITHNGIEVGCQFISKENLQTLFNELRIEELVN